MSRILAALVVAVLSASGLGAETPPRLTADPSPARIAALRAMPGPVVDAVARLAFAHAPGAGLPLATLRIAVQHEQRGDASMAIPVTAPDLSLFDLNDDGLVSVGEAMLALQAHHGRI